MSKCVFCGRTEEEIDGKPMSGSCTPRDEFYTNCLFKKVKLPCVFYYEQEEVKYIVGPYIDFCEVDICHECLLQGSGLHATGVADADMTLNSFELCANYLLKERKSETIKQLDSDIEKLSKRLEFAHRHPFLNIANYFKYGRIWW